MIRLRSYYFLGNVRELENIVERALIQSQGKGSIRLLNYKNTDFSANTDTSYLYPTDNTDVPTLDEINRIYINHILQMAKGKIEGKNGASQYLDLNPNTLRSRIKKLGINIKRK